MLKGVRAQVLSFVKDPFLSDPLQSFVYWNDGLLIYENGIIIEIGEYSLLIKKYADLEIEEYKNSLILPGFIDCHVHYVQSSMIGSYGASLLDWLNKYTFPAESKFKDKEFCDEVAKIFFQQLLKNGTTTANVFCTTFPTSVDAFFEESERYNTRMIAGKVLQDSNLPDELRDSDAEDSVKTTEMLLQKWHNRGRQLYAIVPRFAPSCSALQMKLAGDLYTKYWEQGVYLHTHLNETQDEIAWVRELYPEASNYTEVYNRFEMLKSRTVFAHSCLMQENEWQMLHDANCACAHCPSSNLFLGGGMFKYWEAKKAERPVKVGMGTDVGGGTDFSILKELGDAYKVSMLGNNPLSAIHSFYLATRGGAEALSLADKIGSLEAGYEADFIVLDLHNSEYLDWRLKFDTEDIFSKLFVIQTLGITNLIRSTYVYGKKVYDRDSNSKFIYTNK